MWQEAARRLLKRSYHFQVRKVASLLARPLRVSSAFLGNHGADQRRTSTALATRISLSERTMVQANHTATITHSNKPIHGCSGVPDSSARGPNAKSSTTIAIPLASA